jgi:hypothetical protein
MKIMQPIRQGDVLILPSQVELSPGNSHPLPHLTLAEGEVTGHSHQITQGKAELYQQGDIMYLKVLSASAQLTHEEHHLVEIPQGTWIVRIQREYQPEGFRYVTD